MEASHPSNPPATLRRSRFMENMFDDLPLDEPVRQAKREFNANDDDVERQQPQQQQPHKPLRKRGLNIDWRRWRGNSALARSLLTAGLHLAVTSMLVAILIEFLERERDSEDFVSRRRAISLLIVAGLDCAVDVHALFHCMQRDHRGWVVFLRLALSCGYMVHFLLLAQLGRLFPPEYSYWDCDAKSSDMLMYILVSIVLAWDICHAAHHRDAIFDAITSLLSRFCRNISTEKETDRGTVTKSFVPHVNRPRPAARRSHAQSFEPPKASQRGPNHGHDHGHGISLPRFQDARNFGNSLARSNDGVGDFDTPSPSSRTSLMRLDQWPLPLAAIPWEYGNQSTSTLASSQRSQLTGPPR